MAYLLSQGFEVIGSDLAPRGLTACCQRLTEAELRSDVVLADMSSLPFADEAFDATISINVLNHGYRAELQAAIDDVFRTMRPAGEVLLTVLNTGDWRFGNGEEPEPNTFVLAEGPEKGIPHHLFSQDDLRAWLGAFEFIDLARERVAQRASTAPGGRPVHRDGWQALVRRPEGPVKTRA